MASNRTEERDPMRLTEENAWCYAAIGLVDNAAAAICRERFAAQVEELSRANDRFDDSIWRHQQFAKSLSHFTNCTSIKCMCVEEEARWDTASNVVDDHDSNYLQSGEDF